MGIWRFKLHQMSLRFSPLLLSLIWALNLSAQTAGIPTDSLIAFYPLQDASAQNAASDLLQGVLHGSPEPTADRFGNPMGAMRFESGDYITVPGSNGSVFLPFSVSLWYSPDPDDAYSGTLKPLFKVLAGLLERGAGGDNLPRRSANGDPLVFARHFKPCDWGLWFASFHVAKHKSAFRFLLVPRCLHRGQLGWEDLCEW